MYLLFFLAHGLLHDPGRSIGGGGLDFTCCRGLAYVYIDMGGIL